MGDYLALAKKAGGDAAAADRLGGAASRERRWAGGDAVAGHSLAIRWSEHPTWIELRDPFTGQWHELRAADCFPSIVQAADAERRRERRGKT